MGGHDSLFGGAGADTLTGGGGSDSLSGGSGAERFVFLEAADSTEAAPDLVYDFKKSNNDRLDLSAVG
jgi:Ca2+-binding RTX toxin-like protein